MGYNDKEVIIFYFLHMVRTIGYSILGAVAALVVGMVIGVGQYFSSATVSFVVVIAVGAVAGALVASFLNKA